MGEPGGYPTLTIVTPVHNGRPYLEDTLDAIAAQDYPGLQTIVVDDASTDGSGDVARARGCRVLRADGVGPAAARNVGIEASESELLFFLDADDLPGSASLLRRLADVLRDAPEAGFAQGLIQNFEEGADGQRVVRSFPYRFLNLGSMLWRRRVFDQIGLFDGSLRLCEDLDFLMRCWEQDVLRVLVQTLVLLYRRHPSQMTNGLSGAGHGTMHAYRRRIERIRTGAYDPSVPRRVEWQDYLGMPPARKDEVKA
jgi:glycosyltransferase involved in cell wall biosynthesis